MKIGASKIGRSLWCHEEARVLTTEDVRKELKKESTKVQSRGKLLHERYDVLHRDSYLNLRKILKKLLPFASTPKKVDREKALEEGNFWFERKFGKHVICGVPDWFAQRHFRKIAILEDKTISSREASRFQLPCATLQNQTYCFIMRPIFEKLGYALAPVHKIFYYYMRTSEPIAIKDVYYNEVEYTRDLARIIRVLEKKENPLPPAPFKCLQCRKKIRGVCRVFPLYGFHRKRNVKGIGVFKSQIRWGEQWEIDLRHRLEKAGHYIRNLTGSYWVHQKLGGIKGLDFACVNCGLWFEAKRKSTPFFALNAKPKDLLPYKTFDIWLCFKTPHGIFYVKGSDFIDNLDKATLLRNKWGESYYKWSKRSIFPSLRKTPPPCKLSCEVRP